MGNIVFAISYNANEGLIISPSELLEQYFFGIPLCTADGRTLSMETIREKIRQSQDWTEKKFMLKLNLAVQVDNSDFIRNEWNEWGYVRSRYLVKAPLFLVGFINTTKQVKFPLTWVSINRNSDENFMWRSVNIVPAGTLTPTTNSVVFSGITPNLGFLGMSSIPNYWIFKYITGFHKVPPALLDFVSKLAAVQLLAILGDIILGIGITSASLSLDGLNQNTSYSRNSEAGIFGARIKQYAKELIKQEKELIEMYKGITYMSM